MRTEQLKQRLLSTVERVDRYSIRLTIFLGISLRLIRGIWFRDLEQDEALTYWDAISYSFRELILRTDYFDHDHPPLAFIIYKLWIGLIDNEYSLRVLPVLFSLISIAVVARWIQAWLPKDRQLGTLVLFFFCTSSFFVLHGILFRTYSPGILLSFAALAHFFEAYRAEKRGQRKATWHYIQLMLLVWAALFTDYSALWVVITLVAFCCWLRHLRRPAFTAIAAGVLLNVPWYLAAMLGNLQKIFDSKKRYLPSYGEGFDFFREAAHFGDVEYLVAWHPAFAILPGLIFLAAVWGTLRRLRRSEELGVFLFLALSIPYLATVLTSLLYSPIFDYKNLWFPNFMVVVGALVAICDLKLPIFKRID